MFQYGAVLSKLSFFSSLIMKSALTRNYNDGILKNNLHALHSAVVIFLSQRQNLETSFIQNPPSFPIQYIEQDANQHTH